MCDLGKACRLVARLCPRAGRCGGCCLERPSLRWPASSTVVADPIDTIDTDRLCTCPDRPSRLADCGHCSEPGLTLELEGGRLNDNGDLRCARTDAADGDGVSPALALVTRLCSDDGNLLFSPSDDCWLGVGATFLKVMVHLTSSPENTVGSCQRTKTRMFPGMSGTMAVY